jgi:hypothetical protein
MNKLVAIAVAFGMCAALGGCFYGHVEEGKEIDMGGYYGRIGNDPPDYGGMLGEPSTPANWSKLPLIKRADLHAYGDDEYVQKQRQAAADAKSTKEQDHRTEAEKKAEAERKAAEAQKEQPAPAETPKTENEPPK